MKRQTPHYGPNQIRLWLYIISADCWWGALIICSQISPRMVWIINSDCQPLDLTDHLLVYRTGHCWQAVAFILLCFLKEEQAADASQKDSLKYEGCIQTTCDSSFWNTWALFEFSCFLPGSPDCLCCVISCLFIPCSITRLSLGTLLLFIVADSWQLSTKFNTLSLSVLSLAAQHKSCIFYFIISKPLYCSLDSN